MIECNCTPRLSGNNNCCLAHGNCEGHAWMRIHSVEAYRTMIQSIQKYLKRTLILLQQDRSDEAECVLTAVDESAKEFLEHGNLLR